MNQVIAKRAKVGYSTEGHTGGDVYLGVYSPVGVEKLRGIVDNTEIPQYIAKNLSLNLDSATQQLFDSVEEVATELKATYEVNEEDKDNPYVLMTKENVQLKLHINTNVVEVNVEGKQTTYERLDGVMVYNDGTLYGSTEEISAILTKAVEDNKTEEPSTPQPEDSGKDESNTFEDDKGSLSDSTPNKKPTTGLQAISGVLSGVLITLIGYKGLVTKKENN